MFTVKAALEAFGSREVMSSGELLWRLDPNYLLTYTTKQRAGFHLSKELGVSPHRVYDSQRERWRSEYHRADLEDMGRQVPVAPAPAPPAHTSGGAEPGSDEWLAVRGFHKCRSCGAQNPWAPEDHPCHKCEKTM